MNIFSSLHKSISSYLSPSEVQEIHEAYKLAFSSHEGQVRISGEPYITHPVAVANILSDMRLDYETIIAALLHDSLEDTDLQYQEIESKFGFQVASLVQGVSKLDKIAFKNRAEAQAMNFRKVILAMANDMRVILIKLADRTHNMRTLGSLPADRRRRIAMETLDIYAPIANRLGIHNIKNELEDLGFKACYPIRYSILSNAVDSARLNRKTINKKIHHSIEQAIVDTNIEATVVGRTKNLYSIYSKMRKKELHFQDILDIYAFRVITNDIDDCYMLLGRMHSLYKPKPKRFKDYIAMPKINGYQSLHTSLIGPHGVPIEIQIRTADMNKMADDGVAAHWLYKGDTKINISHVQAQKWMQALLELQKNTSSAVDFLDNVKSDLFPEEIYVFTPDGKIIELPVGATPVDFAYHIHTDIGNRCIGAKVDRSSYPLSEPLNSGQTVEVVVAESSMPNAAWINFVVTSKARVAIRNILKQRKSKDALSLGKRLLNNALTPRNIKSLSDAEKEKLYKPNYKNFNDLLMGIGLGNVISILIVQKLSPDSQIKYSNNKVSLIGTDGLVVNFAKCCCPVYGDIIVGYLSSGKGLIVHREKCSNVNDYNNNLDRYIYVQWDKNQPVSNYTSNIRLELYNYQGALAKITNTIALNESGINHIYTEEKSNILYSIELTILVNDIGHLNKIINELKDLKFVNKAYRVLR